MAKSSPKFSKDSIRFLEKASRQKREDWLDKNRADYEKHIQLPLLELARVLKAEIGPSAPDYHFPQKGIGRIKRSADKAKEYGSHYKNWISYSAARPRTSRFEHNPNIFFLINLDDKNDPVLIAGGLYMPSSRQMRLLRQKMADDSSEFEKLFKTKEFASCFKGGFSPEKISTRFPAGFDRNHPKIHWIRLQAFFVWRPYSMKEFSSPKFPEIVARDAKQILKLNRLLEKTLKGKAGETLVQTKAVKKQDDESASSLFDRISSL